MIRELPDFLINQIAAGEVVERPAAVVKELVENALDAGATQIVVDVADGGRTLISVTDDGCGMSADNLKKCIMRHATSKLSSDDLLNINFMGFRGEALPSIASVSDMTIDTRETSDKKQETSGYQLNCTTGEIKPSAWENGTRIRVANLFAKTPARLKFLRGDRAEMMSVTEIIKRLAMARPDVGFILNNRWIFPRGQTLFERMVSVMGDEVRGRMIKVEGLRFKVEEENISTINRKPSTLSLHGFISEPTLRRASSVEQYLFVNGRPVKDKVLIGALRAAYIDVMSAREFPLCALYLELPSRDVDVNVSPSKTEVHFLEPARIRGFIIKTLRDALATTLLSQTKTQIINSNDKRQSVEFSDVKFWAVRERAREIIPNHQPPITDHRPLILPLGRVIGQIGNKYILSENESGLVITDQHAAHERITYEKLRNREIKIQPLLTPVIINMKQEQVAAVLEIADEMKTSGLVIDGFGDTSIAIYEKPADWDLDWDKLFKSIADEVAVGGASDQLSEKLHLKLANYACHHSVRAGQKLDYMQMDALLRDIEKTQRAGQCNHGRPVYKVFKITDLDSLFERV